MRPGPVSLQVTFDIWRRRSVAEGLTQGRPYQLAAYILKISLSVLAVALWRNWRNDRLGYWLNLCVAGWADSIWVPVVVLTLDRLTPSAFAAWRQFRYSATASV